MGQAEQLAPEFKVYVPLVHVLDSTCSANNTANPSTAFIAFTVSVIGIYTFLCASQPYPLHAPRASTILPPANSVWATNASQSRMIWGEMMPIWAFQTSFQMAGGW